MVNRMHVAFVVNGATNTMHILIIILIIVVKVINFIIQRRT